MNILDSNLDPRFGNARLGKVGSALCTLSALILAPVLGGAIVGGILGVYTIVSSLGMQRPAGDILEFAGIVGVYAGVVGGPGSLLLGWPAHRLLLKFQITKPFAYMAVFAIIGGISPAVIVTGFSFTANTIDPQLALFASICGAVGGLVFWMIRRPDRMLSGE